MRKVVYSDAITLKLTKDQMKIIEGLAERQEVCMSMAARFLMQRSINALGLKP
jgi:hypothetical protein